MANKLTVALAALAAMMMLPASPLEAQTPKAPSDWGLSPGGAIVSVSGASVVNGEATFSAAGQSIVVDAAGAGAINLGVQGTFTGSLKVQWSDKPTTGFQDGKVTNASGAEISTISAPQQYAGGTFARYARITTTSWTSGSAAVTPLLRSQRFSPAATGGGASTIADGADVALGAQADAACGTDNGTCTLSALIKRQNQRLTSLLGAVTPFAITATATITRPADTVTYAVNDAWANSTSAPTAGGYTLAGVCPAAGRVAAIISLAIMSSADPATSLQGEVWIFDSAVTAINDNAAFALSDADAVKLVGVVPFTLATSQGGSGTNAVYTASGLNIAYTCVGTGDLRYVVKVKNAYVPTSAEALTVRANVVGLN